MTAKVTIPNTFATQSGPIPLSQLDDDFTAVADSLNENATLGNYYIDAGSANTLAISTATGQTFTVTASGPWLDVLVAATNTGATTIAINGGTAITVTDGAGQALGGGELVAGYVYRLVFDGASFRIVGYSPAVVTVAYSSGNFTGNASMTWTVTSGQQVTFWYQRQGKLALVTFFIEGTVGGTPNTQLLIALPGSMSPAENTRAPIWTQSGGTSGIGLASMGPGDTQITCYATPNTATAWAAGALQVAGQIWMHTL